ncbi:MAG TPA: hypothetical protein PLW95_04655 [bacterium]|nr:hypothetical protein [bacterium]
MKDRLYFLVEGPDDERFFDKIVKPKFKNRYYEIIILKYAEKTKEGVKNIILSIKKIPMTDYIFVVDINDSPCVTAKKQQIWEKFSYVDLDRIIVVIKKIESWYLAGLDNANAKKLKISSLETTDNVDKGKFKSLVGKESDLKDLKIEILKHFSTEVAMEKNKSFKYFIEKYNCK